MNEEDIEELKRLFYYNRLTQYGKRKLIEYYEQRIEELEKEIESWKFTAKYVQDNYIDKSKVINLINKLSMSDGLEDNIAIPYIKELL